MPKKPLSATEIRIQQIKKENPKVLKSVKIKSKQKSKQRSKPKKKRK